MSETNCSSVPKINAPTDSSSLAFFLLICLLSLTCVGVWLTQMHRFDHTKIRSTTLVVLSMLGTMYTSCSLQLYDYAGHELPCWIMSFLVPNVIPLVVGAISCRLIIFYFHAQFSTQVVDLVPTLTLLGDDDDDEQASGGMAESSTLRNDAGSIKRQVLGAIWLAIDVYRLAVLEFILQRSSKDKLRYVRASKFMVSSIGIWWTASVFAVPFLITTFAFTVINRGYMFSCVGCQVNTGLVIMIGVLAILAILWNLIILFRARNLNDAWGLRREAAVCLAFLIVTFVSFAIAIFVDGAYAKINYLITIFTLLPLVENTLVQLYVGWKKQQQSVNATEDSSIDDNKPTLEQILSNPQLEQAFELHLQREYGMESLLFLRDVNQWKRSYFDISPRLRLTRARRISQAFIDSTGLLQVNIPDRVAVQVQQTLLQANEIDFALFDDAIAEVKLLLITGAVKRFHNTLQKQDAVAIHV